MEYKQPLLAVKDLRRSLQFYHDVLGQDVILDFGANVTLTGGFCLQTADSWAGFLGKRPAELAFGGCDAELYFEEPEFDAFAAKLAVYPGLRLVHPVQEHRWGQRAVRFFDPDGHVIEVGESISAVCRRFAAAGMTAQQIAVRMDVPVDYVREHLQ